MDKALLDTDIFSEVLKGIDQNVVTRAIAYRNAFGSYTISVITVIEIVKGLHKLRREDRIQQFLAGLPTVELLTLNSQGSVLAGRIYADLERTGQPDWSRGSNGRRYCLAPRSNLSYRQSISLPTHSGNGLRFEAG